MGVPMMAAETSAEVSQFAVLFAMPKLLTPEKGVKFREEQFHEACHRLSWPGPAFVPI